MIFSHYLQIFARVLAAFATVLFAYRIVYLLVSLVCRHRTPEAASPCRFAVLIAARNEERVLPQLLESIRRQDYPAQLLDIWVVADNCTDRTAQCAKEGGAYVVTRQDRLHVGKGYALNYLLEQIDAQNRSYDAYMVFDADNVLAPDCISRINETRAQGYDAFCGYRNAKNFGGSFTAAGHSVCYLHESAHINRARHRLGIPCNITGTGFGFTEELRKRCGGWHFFTLTEDLEFSAWCSTHGIRVGYNHDAVFYDEQPETLHQSWRQRTRWVQGAIQVGAHYFPDFAYGLSCGGMTAYASVEMATLVSWGYGLGALCGAVSLFNAVFLAGLVGALRCLGTMLFSAFLYMTAVGTVTVLTQWNRIHATAKQKLMGIPAFAVHMLTYLPIAVTALFRKHAWLPIEHKVHLELPQSKTLF